MFVLLAAVAALLPRVMNLFGGEDPAAGRPWYHQMITRLVAKKAGWDARVSTRRTPLTTTRTAGLRPASCPGTRTSLTSYLYNPLFAAAGGLGRFRAALFAHAEMVKVYFDDLTSTAQINLMWRRYLGGTVAGLLWAADRDDVVAARHIVGVGLRGASCDA